MRNKWTDLFFLQDICIIHDKQFINRIKVLYNTFQMLYVSYIMGILTSEGWSTVSSVVWLSNYFCHFLVYRQCGLITVESLAIWGELSRRMKLYFYSAYWITSCRTSTTWCYRRLRLLLCKSWIILLLPTYFLFAYVSPVLVQTNPNNRSMHFN